MDTMLHELQKVDTGMSMLCCACAENGYKHVFTSLRLYQSPFSRAMLKTLRYLIGKE